MKNVFANSEETKRPEPPLPHISHRGHLCFGCATTLPHGYFGCYPHVCAPCMARSVSDGAFLKRLGFAKKVSVPVAIADRIAQTYGAPPPSTMAQFEAIHAAWGFAGQFGVLP